MCITWQLIERAGCSNIYYLGGWCVFFTISHPWHFWRTYLRLTVDQKKISQKLNRTLNIFLSVMHGKIVYGTQFVAPYAWVCMTRHDAQCSRMDLNTTKLPRSFSACYRSVMSLSTYVYLIEIMKMDRGFFNKAQILSIGKTFPEIREKYKH